MIEWRTTSIEECTEQLGDGLHGTPKYSPQGEYAFINGNNLINGRIEIKSDTKRVGVSEYVKHKKPLGNRTIFVSINGTLGNVGLYRGEKVILGKSVCYFNVKPDVDKDFMFYTVSTPDFRRHMELNATGTTIKNFSLKQMRSYSFQLPDLQTQRKISNVLKNIDAKIENNNAINNHLEQMAQAIYKSWFVDFEPFDDSFVSEWMSTTLGEIANIKTKSWSPAKHPDDIVEYYSIPAFDERHYPTFEIASGIKSNKYVLTSDSVMISKLNPDNKRIWRPVCISENPVCSTEFIVYEAKKSCQKDYIYSVIDSNSFLKYLCSHTTGSTNSRQRATPKSTLEFPLLLPPDSVIDEFCRVVTPVYNLMASNIIENQSLARTRDIILPHLMSGELDVSDLDL